MAYSLSNFGQDIQDFFGWGTNRRQQEFASSAHQIEVEDLKQAGLNPVLSATSGMGSQTPYATKGDGLSQISNIINSATKAGQKSNNETKKGLENFMSAAQILLMLGK